jgi:hypothetical protein
MQLQVSSKRHAQNLHALAAASMQHVPNPTTPCKKYTLTAETRQPQLPESTPGCEE